jgi:long-chain acyl-CoA synthetase
VFDEHELKKTLASIFFDRAQAYGDRTALLRKNKESKTYSGISWTEWADQVKWTALGISTIGVKRGDRVAILSENCPEWAIADLAILSLGAIVVPLYFTSSTPEIEYILENAGVEVLFVSSSAQLERITSLLTKNVLRHVIVFESIPCHGKVLHLDVIKEKGKKEESAQREFISSLQSVSSDEVATLIYTSGTTGPPKGVMLTHKNFISNYLACHKRIHVSETDTALSFLPLSHVFERLAGYYFLIFHGVQIAYAENMQTVPDDIQLVKPTLSAAVPRFYEKVYARILEKVDAGPALAKHLFYWALKVGKARSRYVFEKKSLPLGLALQFALAKALVFKKIKNKLGGRLRFFISGGAPLSKELAEFFYAAGILILEGYGLTETSPVISVNAPDAFRFGTVGKPLDKVEVKIASDGEILVRADSVMKGYYKNPKATEEVMAEGWFHTGDIGLIDPDGFLKITDRKKDIIVTSGGKNVSPQNIENLLLGDRLFSQVVVLGDKRNYLVALIALNKDEVLRYAEQLKIDSRDWKKLLAEPEIYEWVEFRIKEKTKDLAPYEQIKYFALLERELSQESGEMTPTLKIRRKIIMEKYSDIIEGLYSKGKLASETSTR